MSNNHPVFSAPPPLESLSTSNDNLPQIPVFAPIDSPLPPTGLLRSWDLVTPMQEIPSLLKTPASSAPTALEYGSDNDEDDVKKMSLEELQSRCLVMMKAAKKSLTTTNAAVVVPNSPQQPRQVLSPALYSVSHTRSAQGKTHEVKRLQLGRTSSIATRDELGRLANSFALPTQVNNDAVMQMNRLNHILKFPPEFEYLSSRLFADDLLDLCARVGALFEQESRVLEVKSPLYVFGDIHGNVQDLNFFAESVWPLGMPLTAGSFLFLGDYVDRGNGGLEVLAYLFAQKLQVPQKIFMLRGNHETRSVNGWEEYYGNASFLAQCKNRFGEEKGSVVWEECNRVFDRMPLVAIVDKTIFCVHGGIPRPPPKGMKDTRLDDIRMIPCPMDVRQPSIPGTGPYNRLAFSLLWSDPAATEQEHMLEKDTGFGASMRGSGSVVFGQKAVEDFLTQFNLGYIMRAHEATVNGVQVSKSAKVLTVFSTSKDHGCGGEAKCGCVLVDTSRIVAIIRSPDYDQPSVPPAPPPSTASSSSSHHPPPAAAATSKPVSSQTMVGDYNKKKNADDPVDDNEVVVEYHG